MSSFPPTPGSLTPLLALELDVRKPGEGGLEEGGGGAFHMSHVRVAQFNLIAFHIRVAQFSSGQFNQSQASDNITHTYTHTLG